jgi:hypothetical protein
MLADAVRQGLLLANPAARADLPPAQDFAGKEIRPAHTDAIRQALIERAPTIRSAATGTSSSSASSTLRSALAFGSASFARSVGEMSTASGA